MTRFTFLAAFLAATATHAGEMVRIDAVQTTEDASEMMEISESAMVLNIHGRQTIAAAGQPFDGATGDCHGAVLSRDGAFEGAGYCLYDVPDGAKFVVRWNATAPGTGTWEMMGGTGKFAGATGGGEFMSTGTETGAPTKISGEIEMQ